MTIEELLSALSARGVRLEVRSDGGDGGDGGQRKLQVHAPSGVLTAELREAISRHREALIEKLALAERSAVALEAALEASLPAIVPNPARAFEPFPLNHVQHAYWIGRGAHVELGGVSSHIYFEFECGELDPTLLSRALDRVVAAHGMLRATIDANGLQRVHETVPPYEIAVLDLRDHAAASPERAEAEAARVRGEMSHQVFDCARWPLFDIRLIVWGGERTRLCVSLDFLVIDALSMSILFQQWHRAYVEPTAALHSSALSFRDYVLAEAEVEKLPAHQAAKKYWWDRIDQLPASPQLPLARLASSGAQQRFTRRRLRLLEPEWSALKERARSSGLTLSSLLLAAFSEILARWSKSPHFALNLTLFHRLPMHPEVGSIIGDFTNLLVLEVDQRHEGAERGTFLERARRLQTQFLDDFEHRGVSAVEVMRELAKRRGWQQRAILPVVFTSTLMLEAKASASAEADAGARAWELFGRMEYGITQTPQAYLDEQIFEVSGELIVNWDTVEEMFLPGVLDDMFDAHRRLLATLAARPETWHQRQVVDLPSEQIARRAEANATACASPDTHLFSRFVECALAEPERIAVVTSTEEIPYGELLARADAVAQELIARDVLPNELVAILCPKGWQQVVAALGIQLAGAAYLPIDPRWPTLRRHQLLRQGEARIALTTPALDRELEWPAGIETEDRVALERIAIPPRESGSPPYLSAPPPVRQATTDLAYVIFTSGSTGTPKGVMIDHRGAVNTVVHINRLWNIGAEDRVLAVSDLTFDLSVWDLFGPLAVGGALVVPDAALARDPGHWSDLIARTKVTVWDSAPPLLGMLADAAEAGSTADLSSLRLVLLSGDWIPVPLPDRIRHFCPRAEVVSLGGATEGSIWSIYFPVDQVDPRWDSIPYGKALPNQSMHVFDRELEPRPDLVVGDIYIGGTGVALGYWKDEERTAKQFLRHPETGERLYATGDLGRVLRDGNIEFLGREDFQVKLRGHRVELGEITAALQGHPEVKDAIVQLVKEDGRAALAAYVVPRHAEQGSLYTAAEIEPETLGRMREGIAAAGVERTHAASREELRAFSEFWQALEPACLRSMAEALSDLGLIENEALSDLGLIKNEALEAEVPAASSASRLDDLVAEGRVRAPFRRIVERWLHALVERGWLVVRDGRHRVVDHAAVRMPALAVDLETQLAALDARFGNDLRLASWAAPYLGYVSACLRSEIALLSGAISPLDLLFPDGSFALAEALYERGPVSRHHNQMAAAIVRAQVAALAETRALDSTVAERPLRVLEVGAGTGGTTSSILPELPATRTEYWFTDVSPYFFANARNKFAPFPFVQFATLDLLRDPKLQGHAPHGYDLIVAANVVHNAINVDLALRHLRELLAPAGHLLLVEGTRNTPWQWATISYLEIVPAYEDERAASDQPLLSVESWLRALERNGFEEVTAFPGTESDGDLATWLEAMPQHVIAARGPARVERFAPEVLAQHLAARLPAHMVPQRFFELDRLPLSANGKVDVSALPRALSAATERRVIFPRSELEKKILRIWQDVLGVATIGVADNFFEVGGDSLLLTAVLRRLNQERERPLSTAELFAHPTVQSLAEYLEPARLDRAAAPRPRARFAPFETRRARGERSDDIAIVGMAARLPDAGDVETYWRNLAAGACAVRTWSDPELLAAGVSPEDLSRDNYVRAGVVLADMDRFDAQYFGYSPREAEVLDPQQRFLFECAVEALEFAGYPNERFGGTIGVFVGKGTSFYFLEHVLPRTDLVQRYGMMALLNLHEKDYAATLLSYKLDLTGPAVNINTACSTSLVAVHSAARALLDGECSIALAGGVSFVTTLARSGYLYDVGQIASKTGLCRAFSDDADGCVFGNGVGLVVLRPLDAARAAGDTVLAVIKGSAINNDGAVKVGFNAPSPGGQADAIDRALARAQVTPESIRLLEAHGTGTALGDPIEFAALRRVFGGRRADGSRSALGSVKTNIGHVDSAAGVAGLIKVIQALRYEVIPPTLHAPVPSRQLDFADSPFELNGTLIPWPASGPPRRAGVSSFGVGGTNAHVVVEEAPRDLARQMFDAVPSGPQLLVISAKTRAALERGARSLTDHLASNSERSLADVAWTLQVGRNAHRHRAYVVASKTESAWMGFADVERLTVVEPSRANPAVALLLPGQGTQRPGVTRELYETRRVFRAVFDECREIVSGNADVDLGAWLYGGLNSGEDESVDIDQTEIAQPLLFAVEVALARLWESLGVRPVAYLGHSLGELVAAHLAGVFTLEEALALVVVRGRLLQNLPAGSMAAVSGSEERLRQLIVGSGCDLAAINGPLQCVISGPSEAVAALRERLAAVEVSSRLLRTSHAFHSSLVEPILDTFEQCVAAVERKAPRTPFVSNVTGTWITDEQATSPAYWAQHLRAPVRFADGVRALSALDDGVLLESGPGDTASTLARMGGAPAARVVATFGRTSANAHGSDHSNRSNRSTRSTRSSQGECHALFDAVGRLWQLGVEIDWRALHEDAAPRRVPLPTYSWEPHRYWLPRLVDVSAGVGAAAGESGDLPPELGAEDRAELEAVAPHHRPELRTAFVAPSGDIEEPLAAIWRDFFGIAEIGARDDFFELGGDSLLATRMFAEVKRELGVELPIAKLFALSTIRRISLYLLANRDPTAIDRFAEEDLDDLLTLMEP